MGAPRAPSDGSEDTELHSFNRGRQHSHDTDTAYLTSPAQDVDVPVDSAVLAKSGGLFQGKDSALTLPQNNGPSLNMQNLDNPDRDHNPDGLLASTLPAEIQGVNGHITLGQASHQHHLVHSRQEDSEHNLSKRATHLYVISYLILFSLLGTLARLGLQAITVYPGAPVVFGVLWANFAGSLIMGFLNEDRMLFKEEWGTPTSHRQAIQEPGQLDHNEGNGCTDSESAVDIHAAKKKHTTVKKTIPLYVGLATGFCGSFTSFSSFIRDVYLALSNDLPTPRNHVASFGAVGSTVTSTVSRNGGYSFMALLTIIITTVCLCVSSLFIGAHIAIATAPYIPSIPFRFSRKVLDRIAVVLGWGCWLGAVFLAIFPPDRHHQSPEVWRGRAVFALVFAPLGCLGRFYASLYLNGRIASFPLGTFLVNVFGTAVLGMSYDLQHVPLGDVFGCQVLQGIEDGFCGCLTTVSTWALELTSLRRRHAYMYGVVSIVVALCLLIAIMGSMQWTIGFSELRCIH